MAVRTGAEFIAGLRDQREGWLGNERVADVTIHPASRAAVESVARLYAMQHDPAYQHAARPLADKWRSDRAVVFQSHARGTVSYGGDHERGLGGRDLWDDGPECGLSQCHGYGLGSLSLCPCLDHPGCLARAEDSVSRVL